VLLELRIVPQRKGFSLAAIDPAPYKSLKESKLFKKRYKIYQSIAKAAKIYNLNLIIYNFIRKYIVTTLKI